MAVTNAANIASNDADIAALSSDLATVSGDLSTLSTNVVTNYATKKELSDTAADIRDEVDTRFTNMNEGMDEINTWIDALNVKILALSGNN
jgi:chromosome segregation ATPase